MSDVRNVVVVLVATIVAVIAGLLVGVIGSTSTQHSRDSNHDMCKLPSTSANNQT